MSDYVVSGDFRAAIEAATGAALMPRSEPELRPDWLDEQLALLPPGAAAEVEALHDLYATHQVPRLCGLAVGDFLTLPEQYGDERPKVLRSWFAGDEAATDVVMRALELYRGNGGVYVVVSGDGVGVLLEDPHEYVALGCDLPRFLERLVRAHAIAVTQGLDPARASLGEVVGERLGRMLVLSRVLPS